MYICEVTIEHCNFCCDMLCVCDQGRINHAGWGAHTNVAIKVKYFKVQNIISG